MKFKTEDEVLRFFEDGGCLLDSENSTVYISDVNADGEFFGIMVAENIPAEECESAKSACQYALDYIPAPGAFGAKNRMGFMEAPGFWFSKFCEEVVADTEFKIEEEA